MEATKYGFLGKPSVDKWTGVEIREVQEVLAKLDIQLESASGVVYIGNVGEFPPEIPTHPIITRFLREVGEAVRSRDLESVSFDQIVDEVRKSFRLMGGI